MDTKLLDILACPITKGPLKLSADKTELISKGAGRCSRLSGRLVGMACDWRNDSGHAGRFG